MLLFLWWYVERGVLLVDLVGTWASKGSEVTLSLQVEFLLVLDSRWLCTDLIFESSKVLHASLLIELVL